MNAALRNTLVVVLLLLTALVAFWFVRNFEKTSEEITLPAYGEPTYNALYALRETLIRDGSKAEPPHRQNYRRSFPERLEESLDAREEAARLWRIFLRRQFLELFQQLALPLGEILWGLDRHLDIGWKPPAFEQQQFCRRTQNVGQERGLIVTEAALAAFNPTEEGFAHPNLVGKLLQRPLQSFTAPLDETLCRVHTPALHYTSGRVALLPSSVNTTL